MDESNPEIMTIEEAAKYLRVPLSSLYRLAQDGKVPCQKVGRHWRFLRQSLATWVANEHLSFDEKKPKTPRLDFS